MNKTTVLLSIAGVCLVASLGLNFRQWSSRVRMENELALAKEDEARAIRTARENHLMLENERRQLQSARDRAAAEASRPTPRLMPRADPSPEIRVASPEATQPSTAAAKSRALMAAYLGEPVLAPAALDPKYSSEGITAAFLALCEARGVKVRDLGVDTSEFPFLIYGRVVGGRDFFRQIDTELNKDPGYVYGGSVVGGGPELTSFSLNVTPRDAYPREQIEAIDRRLMVRLHMLGVIWNDPPR